jgi:hypothetical protein
LLQVVMYHSYCKNWKTPAVVAECDHGHDPSELSCLSCFCWKLTLVLACIWIKVILVQTILLLLLLNLSCNNSTELRYMLNYLWNGCNIWPVMLDHYDLGLYVGWFEISQDFIGLPGL